MVISSKGFTIAPKFFSIIADGFGAKAGQPAISEVAQKSSKVADLVKDTFGNLAVLNGIRGDIAVIKPSYGNTIFARIGKDFTLKPLKTKQICIPTKLSDGRIVRRRLDYSPVKTLDGQQVQKVVRTDRLYSHSELVNKSRVVNYNAPNAINGHYTNMLPYSSHAEYDISNGTYHLYKQSTSRPIRSVGEKGTLAYKNGHLTTQRTERWVSNPNFQVNDIRGKIGNVGF